MYFVIKLVNDSELKVDYTGDLKVLRITINDKTVDDTKVDLKGVESQPELRKRCKMHFERLIYEELKEKVQKALNMDLDVIAMELGPTDDVLVNVLLNYKDLLYDLEDIIMRGK